MTTTKNDGKCDRTRCRERLSLTYLGTGLCWKHWLEHCHKQDRIEEAGQQQKDENDDKINHE